MTLQSSILSDLSIFLSTGDFAVSAVYSGNGATISVIFDEASDIGEIEGVRIEGTGPRALCKTSDLPSVDHAKTLTINSVAWKIREVQPDGTGMTTVLLKR